MGSVAKAACVLVSLCTAVAAACGADLPERSWDDAGLSEPEAVENSNPLNAPPVNEERTWHNASDNGGLGARADEYVGGGKTAPPRSSDAAPGSEEANAQPSTGCRLSVDL